MTRSPDHPITPILLNPEQQLAVNAGRGAYAVLAGPGSGKTQVIAQRFARLSKITRPENILTLTFTAEAAKNMRDRAGLKPSPGAARPFGFLTFHSLALSFATIERASFPFKLATFPLATDGQAAKFLGEASRRNRVKFKELRQYVSLKKHDWVRPEDAIIVSSTTVDRSLALAYRDYEKKCRDAGVLDFDSLLLEMVSLLTVNPEVNARWQYDWIQIDEAQDADAMQWRLVQLLSQEHGNIFAVGDAGQCVYEWRGAHPTMFLEFEKLFPGAQKLYLAKNHRSTKEIVKFCSVIAPIKELGSRFYTENEQGLAPQITPHFTSLDETDWVVKQVASSQQPAAILARTNRMLRPFEDKLSEAGIKYHLLGKSGFFSQPEIRNILAFVQCAIFPTDAATLTAIRSPYEPCKYIRKKELIEELQSLKGADHNLDDFFLGIASTKPYLNLLDEYHTSDEQQERAIKGLASFLHSLNRYRNSSAKAAVSGIVNDLRAVDYYTEEEESPDIDNSPQENIDELIKISERYQTVPELLDYVRRVQGAARSKKGVAIGTIHSAKGREWNRVFLTNAAEGYLPHKNGELEEEARIFFVACSRAAKELFISYAGQPSRFIEQFVAAPGRVLVAST